MSTDGSMDPDLARELALKVFMRIKSDGLPGPVDGVDIVDAVNMVIQQVEVEYLAKELEKKGQPLPQEVVGLFVVCREIERGNKNS